MPDHMAKKKVWKCLKCTLNQQKKGLLATCRDENEDIVEDGENAVGLKAEYVLIHPYWLIFVDEARDK